MNILNRVTDENVLVLSTTGRIDSGNAMEFESGLMDLLGTHPGLDVVFDASDITYMSSAGLRVFLKIQQRLHRNLIIDNVQQEVYTIFETAGFNRMMEVHKVMRNIGSFLQLKTLGVSVNGRSYKLSEDELVKVYKSSVKLSDIQKERELAQEALIMGVPTAIPFDVVKCGDQNYYGVIFEAMKSAETLASAISKNRGRLEEYARRLGSMVRELHKLKPDKEIFPNIKERYREWIEMSGSKVPQGKLAEMKKLIEAMPDSDYYVHGDLRIDNVMVLDDDLILTDMAASGYGHKIFDLQGLYASLVEMEKETPYYSSTKYGLTQEECIRIWETFYKEYMGDRDMSSYNKINSLLKNYYKLTQTLSGIFKGTL